MSWIPSSLLHILPSGYILLIHRVREKELVRSKVTYLIAWSNKGLGKRFNTRKSLETLGVAAGTINHFAQCTLIGMASCLSCTMKQPSPTGNTCYRSSKPHDVRCNSRDRTQTEYETCDCKPNVPGSSNPSGMTCCRYGTQWLSSMTRLNELKT